MPIVFDQVEGVVAPSAEPTEDAATPAGDEAGAGGGDPHAMHDVDRHLARAQRRQQRLSTD